MRHWVVGNGYSIKNTPLHLLENEITWGLNRSPIKPTYYVCIDVAEQDSEWKKYIQLDCEKVFLLDKWKDEFFGNIEWITWCKKHKSYPSDHINKRAVSWHLPNLCCSFGTMYTVLQLAVLEGATEIYLVGCDLFTGENDHHDSNYPEFADWKERNEIENYLHTVSNMSSPVPIFNATIGGSLEVYGRVDIHKILGVQNG